MAHIYKYYRQINIDQGINQDKPQMSGFEEFYCDGKREVYNLNEQEILAKLKKSHSLLDFLLDSELPRLGDWQTKYDFPPQLRSWLESNPDDYIHPQEFVVEVAAEPQEKSSWSQKIASSGQVLQQGWRKLQKMFQRLPSALRVAWQELNR